MKTNNKLLSIIFLFFLALSCNQKDPRKEIKLEIYLNDFFKQNKNWNQNDVIREEVNNKFRKEIEIEIKKGILDDFPLELVEVNEYEKGKYAALFASHYPKDEELKYDNILNDTSFDLICLIKKEDVKTLQQNKFYTVKGEFKKFLKGDYEYYIKGSVYTPLVRISENYGNEVSIGIILIDNIKAKETSKL